MLRRQTLTDRVRAALARVSRVRELRMFGGTAFMVNGKMCITAGHNRLMCRIDPERHQAALGRKGARTVRMKGRTYIGYIHVNEDAVATKRDLDYWVKLCLDFNRKAKSYRARRS